MTKGKVEQRGKKAPEEKILSQKEGLRKEDDCRCKDMSKKTPRELLKVMIGDLSFWKKRK